MRSSRNSFIEALEPRRLLSLSLLADINSTTANGVSQAPVVVLGNAGYLVANDGIHGEELWKTNGTTGGTAMLIDIALGSESSFPSVPQVAGGLLYFQARDPTNGLTNLW